ncbi:hypothetical protein [Streptomyces gilvus]|uniref:hypothetical protein n=1 Tax=Streptomyces gilvus TaxID=2920937 RepID=UPI001F0E2C09|nr:hypothetical protein [Streptomyces sp. CME 23]MCH5677275.1 hypothetical protein [Streptomyces sp. CME 23]
MTQGWKITIVVGALAAVGSTPLVWLADGPNAGQLVGATVQAAAGIAALVWALFQHPAGGPGDEAVDTGAALAEGGGMASTGIKRPGGRGRWPARVQHTGKATAKGPGSKASSGIDYSGD